MWSYLTIVTSICIVPVSNRQRRLRHLHVKFVDDVKWRCRKIQESHTVYSHDFCWQMRQWCFWLLLMLPLETTTPSIALHAARLFDVTRCICSAVNSFHPMILLSRPSSISRHAVSLNTLHPSSSTLDRFLFYFAKNVSYKVRSKKLDLWFLCGSSSM